MYHLRPREWPGHNVLTTGLGEYDSIFTCAAAPAHSSLKQLNALVLFASRYPTYTTYVGTRSRSGVHRPCQVLISSSTSVEPEELELRHTQEYNTRRIESMCGDHDLLGRPSVVTVCRDTGSFVEDLRGETSGEKCKDLYDVACAESGRRRHSVSGD